MTPRYSLLPAADQDFDDQADDLAQEVSLDIALHFYDSARTTFEHLARMPTLGERRVSANPRLAGMRVSRIEGFENHLVFYRPVEDGIEIIRILHGACDIDRVLAFE